VIEIYKFLEIELNGSVHASSLSEGTEVQRVQRVQYIVPGLRGPRDVKTGGTTQSKSSKNTHRTAIFQQRHFFENNERGPGSLV